MDPALVVVEVTSGNWPEYRMDVSLDAPVTLLDIFRRKGGLSSLSFNRIAAAADAARGPPPGPRSGLVAVDFRFAERADYVRVAGDFGADGWAGAPVVLEPSGRGADGGVLEWRAEVLLPRGARVLYKFIVDGEWRLDPANPAVETSAIGSVNSVLVVPDGEDELELEGSSGAEDEADRDGEGKEGGVTLLASGGGGGCGGGGQATHSP